MNSRLLSTLHSLKSKGEKAMGIFLTSGFPDPSVTNLLLDAVDQGGADFIELGMPHSDPLAEGLPIQHSSTCALQAGVTMQNTLEAVTAFRKHSDTPLLLMGYINPILRFGMEEFCKQAASAGADGLIIPDLPPQESSPLREQAQKNGLNMVFLVAPNTPTERMEEIDRMSDGFVYCVSITGLTGTGITGRMDMITTYLKHARQIITKNPLLVGFGIQTQEDAHRLSKHTDGFIVGSAVVKEIEHLWARPNLSLTERGRLLARFVRSLK
ncbi:MAG: tryptophan synthase subunit alpha [Bacteroidetes bacterium]|nr:tryptophan synthase subunit alpha [Bacteroidota bacterium]